MTVILNVKQVSKRCPNKTLRPRLACQRPSAPSAGPKVPLAAISHSPFDKGHDAFAFLLCFWRPFDDKNTKRFGRNDWRQREKAGAVICR